MHLRHVALPVLLILALGCCAPAFAQSNAEQDLIKQVSVTTEDGVSYRVQVRLSEPALLAAEYGAANSGQMESWSSEHAAAVHTFVLTGVPTLDGRWILLLHAQADAREVWLTAFCTATTAGDALVYLGEPNYGADAGALGYDPYEPNGSMAYAYKVISDEDYYGYIEPVGDVDYFYIEIVPNLSGKLNVYVGSIPSGQDYDLYLYNSSGTLLASSTNTSNADELISRTGTLPGKYYMKVVGKTGCYSSTDSYLFRCHFYPNPGQWYSQIDPSQSVSTYTWADAKLDNVFYINNSDAKTANTPLEWNKYEQGDYVDPNGLPCYTSGMINMWGCTAASWGMVLKNMGRLTPQTHYDVRTNTTGYLKPDPFTVALANTSWAAITYNSTTKRYESTWEHPLGDDHSPLYIVDSWIATGFGVTAARHTFSTETEEQKAHYIHDTLKTHPQGVLVRLNGHTLVFCQSLLTNSDFTTSLTLAEAPSSWRRLTPGEQDALEGEEWRAFERKGGNPDLLDSPVTITATPTKYESGFIVCDPATSNPTYGANVKFSLSYSFLYAGHRLAEAEWVLAIDK